MPNGQLNEPDTLGSPFKSVTDGKNATEGLLQNQRFETLLQTYPATRRWSDRSQDC